jgi:hypothetical protein
MGLAIETLNGGQIEMLSLREGVDYEVLIGELPSIPYTRFCNDVTSKMPELLTKTSSENKRIITDKILRLWSEYKDFQEKRPFSPSILQNRIPTNSNLAQSLFSINDNGTVGIAESYVVSHLGFADMAFHILGGGFFGWRKDPGIFPPAKECIRRLAQSVS